MKPNSNMKFKRYPFAISQKKAGQQWNSLLKMSMQKKRFYKYNTRFFSLEYGVSLPKRIYWQMSVPNPLNMKNVFKNEKQSVLLHPWNAFRSLFFGKMWILNNPSLVPGIVWPMKSKKILLAKIRAFKTICHLVGKNQKKFVFKQIQKVLNIYDQTKPMVWTFASSLDSLNTNFLLKCGFHVTLSSTFPSISHKKWNINGSLFQKPLSYHYPADVLFMNKSVFSDNCLIFSEFFTYGLLKQTSKKNQASVHFTKPFLWQTCFFGSKKMNHFKKS